MRHKDQALDLQAPAVQPSVYRLMAALLPALPVLARCLRVFGTIRKGISATLFLAGAILANDAAPSGEPRLALLIANGAYGNEMGRLSNPVNDLKLMATTLKALGFEVIAHTDADQKTMKRAIQVFGERLEKTGNEAVGLFYYAGHGLQVGGMNYLIPTNAQIQRDSDVEIEAVNADWVLRQMEFAHNRINVVILDACRNNPLARSFRSVTRGLAQVDAPRGTLIAYSTAPGSVSVDGEGANSPYTKALARAMREPGIVAEEVFRKVRVDVLTATGDLQVPWESSSLTGAFYFSPPSSLPSKAAPGDEAKLELAFWDTIKDSREPSVYREYLDRFPGGNFAGLARLKLNELSSAAASDKAALHREQKISKAEPVYTAPPSALQPRIRSAVAGLWEGEYRCQDEAIGFSLDITEPQGSDVTAVFEFFPLPGSLSFPRGKFSMSGHFDPVGKKISLESGEWIKRPLGFERHDIEGQLEASGSQITGRILTTGCAEFVLKARR